MKKNYIAGAAALLVTFLFSECKQRPPHNGLIPFDTQKAEFHAIPIGTAESYTTNFRAIRSRLSDIVAKTGDSLNQIMSLPAAESFNRDAFAVLLNQKDAQGIRIYFGADKEGKVRLVMVPIDSKGNDIITHLIARDAAVSIPGISSAVAQDDAQAMENGQRCDPPPCVPSRLYR